MPPGDRMRVSSDTKKANLLEHLRSGKTVIQACDAVGLSRESYYAYRKNDKLFKRASDLIRNGETEVESVSEDVPDFPEFCEEFLGMRLFPHQLQWFDIMEGRPPRDLHPAMTYERNDPNLLVVNTPPGHAKSTTLTVAYSVWCLIKEPSTKIVIVSKAQKLAVQFLHSIKNRLTGPQYRKLQDAFAPPGGFDADSTSWKQDLIYLSSSVRQDGEKDPSVQALGIGGQLYGARADMIIVDDAVDNSNAHDYEKQIHWLQTEVMSRIPDGGRIIVIGTRMAPRDLYRELLNPDRYHDDDNSPWTYFAQPAVLEFAEKPEDWVTLWPQSDQPAMRGAVPAQDGLFEKWSGRVLAKRRSQLPPSSWARVYMQEQVAEDTVFKLEHIRACTSARQPGLMPDDPTGQVGRPGGMRGLKIIAGLDPASVGFTAAVVIGVEITTGMRYVLDVHNEAAMPPDKMRNLIKDWTDKYHVDMWRIERNAFQAFLTRDTEIRQYLAARGSVLVEHLTGGHNKNNGDFGVMAMAGLFESGLIQLPRLSTEAMKALVEQLSVWAPDASKHSKTDTVMALWFAELRALEIIRTSSAGRAFTDANRHFLSRADVKSRVIVNASDAEFAGSHNYAWGG